MKLDTDERLMMAYQSGSAAAFEELMMNRYYSRLIAYFLRARFATAHEDAEDLASQTVLKVIKAAGTYEHERAPFKVWLYRVAYTTGLDHQHDSHGDPKIELHLVDDEEDGRPIEQCSSGPPTIDTVLLVEELLTRLSPNEQQLILHRYMIGLSATETAAVIGITTSAVNNRLHDAINKLRALMETAKKEQGAEPETPKTFWWRRKPRTSGSKGGRFTS